MPEPAQIRARAAWSAAAKRAFREVAEAFPGLDKAAQTGLYTACDLLSAADKMQTQIDADGLMVAGSQGQKVAHPLIAEVRQYRRQSQDILRQLQTGAPAAASPGAALAQKRWTSRPAAGATVTPIRKSDAPF